MSDRKVLTRPYGVVGVVTQSDQIIAGGVKTTDDATDVSVEATGAGSNAKVIADRDALFTARGKTTPWSSAEDDELLPAFTRRNIIGALNQLRESYNAILSDVISANALDQVMDQFTTDGDGGIEWFYFVASGSRIRAGKLMVAWDESLGTVELLDTHTPDTVAVTVTFSVYHDGTDLFLMATESTGLEYQFYATKVSPDGRYVTVSESPTVGNLQSVLNAGSTAVIDTDIEILISDARDGVGSSNAVKELVTVRNEGAVGVGGKEALVEHRVECPDDGGLNAGNAGHRYDSKVKSGESLSFYEIFAEWAGKVAFFRVENSEGITSASASADVVRFQDVNLAAYVPISESGVSALATTSQSLVGAINEANAAAVATPAHKLTHQKNGSDEISVTGLSGVLATAQATNADGITMMGAGSTGDKLRSTAGLQNAWDYGRSINTAYGPLLSTWADATISKRSFAWYAGTNQADAVSNGAFSSFTVTGPTTFFTGWVAADYNNVFHSSPTPSPEGGSTSKGTPYYAQVVTDQMIPATLTQTGSLTVGARYRVSGWIQYRQPTSPPAEPNNGSASVIFGGVTVGTTYTNAVWLHFDQEVVALGPDVVCSVDGYGAGFATSVRSGLFSFISAIPLDTPYGVVQVDGDGNSWIGSRDSDVFGAMLSAASTSGGNAAISRLVVGDGALSGSMGLELLNGVTYGRVAADVVSLQDQYTAPILLADALNTAFATTNQTIIGAVNEAVAGGGGIIVAGSGLLSSLRDGADCTVSGDYSFAVGYFNSVSGSSNVVGGQYSLLDVNSSWNIVGGSSMQLEGASNNLVSGNYNRLVGNAWANSVAGSNHQIRTNFVNGSLAGNKVSGGSQDLMSISGIGGSTEYCAQNDVSGYGNLIYGCSNSTVFGSYNKCFLSAYSVIGGTSNKVGGSNSSAVFGYDNRNSTFNVGSSISFSLAGSTVTLTDSSNPFNSTIDGMYLVVYGTDGNNGGFTVTFISSSQISYTNGAGQTESGTDFTGWRVTTSNYNYSLVVGAYNKPGGLSECIVVGNGIGPYTSNDFRVYTHSGSAIFGAQHMYRAGWAYSQVSGYGHNLAEVQYSSVSGQNNTANSVNGATYCSSISGDGNTFDHLRNSILGGAYNTLTSCTDMLVVGNSCNLNMQSSVVSGYGHYIQNASQRNAISGSDHATSGSYQVTHSSVSGQGHSLAVTGDSGYNSISGHQHKLQSEVFFSHISGKSISAVGYYNSLSGYYHVNQSEYSLVSGESNNVGRYAYRSAVFGGNNKVSLGNMGYSISFAKSGSLITMTDSSGFFTPDLQGRDFTIISALNSGTFGVNYISPTQIRWSNAAGSDEGAAELNRWYLADYSANCLVGGNSNQAINSSSMLIAGYGNKVIDTEYASVSGLGNELEDASYSAVSGSNARATSWATKVHSGGPPVTGAPAGSGQIIEWPCSGQTEDDSNIALSLNGMVGDDKVFYTTPDHAYLFTLDFIAKCGAGPSAGGIKSGQLLFTINNNGANNVIVGTPVYIPLSSTSIANENSWAVSVRVSGSWVYIDVTGFSGETIWWQCSVRGVEVGMFTPS